MSFHINFKYEYNGLMNILKSYVHNWVYYKTIIGHDVSWRYTYFSDDHKYFLQIELNPISDKAEVVALGPTWSYTTPQSFDDEFEAIEFVIRKMMKVPIAIRGYPSDSHKFVQLLYDEAILQHGLQRKKKKTDSEDLNNEDTTNSNNTC